MINATIVLFGGTGDLASRKLIPAFIDLIEKGKIAKKSLIIGIGRKNLDDESYKKFLISKVDEKSKDKIEELNIKFFRGDVSSPDGLQGLGKLMSFCEIEGCNRVYYLATSFKFFPGIIRKLKELGLDKQKKGFTRIVFEKPFGENLKSSEELDNDIHRVFSENEVYRIDHYLAKETVQNLHVLSFMNPILYSTLNNEFVDSIEIEVRESLAVEDRIEYYNEAGAIKDMFQNHLLQILSLILLNRPKSLDSKSIHAEKLKVLKDIEILGAENHFFGQYKSYKEELENKDLNDKKTETFLKVVLNCNNKRWNGVKLILTTGKKLDKKFGEIKINFKESTIKHGYSGAKPNKILIGIYPKQDVNIVMNTLDVNQDSRVKDVKFEFCHACEFGPNTKSEYSVLLNEVLLGKKDLFASDEEIKECWKITEKLERMKEKIRFVYYEDGKNPEDF